HLFPDPAVRRSDRAAAKDDRREPADSDDLRGHERERPETEDAGAARAGRDQPSDEGPARSAPFARPREQSVLHADRRAGRRIQGAARAPAAARAIAAGAGRFAVAIAGEAP